MAAHRWLPPDFYRAEGLPAGEVVSVSECVTDFHPHDRESMFDHPWHASLPDALDAAGSPPVCTPGPDPEHVIKRLWKRVTKRGAEETARLGAVHTLAMSVPAADAASLRTMMTQYIGDYPHPILVNLAEGAPPPAGHVLGFEVLGFDQGQFHTWLCYGLHRDVAKEFGIVANDRGLLGTLTEARLVADTANQGIWVNGLAEEYTWFPVLITQHDRTPIPAAS